MNIALYNLTRTRSLHRITTMKSALCLVVLVMLATLAAALPVEEKFEDSHWAENLCRRSLSRILAQICWDAEEASIRNRRSTDSLKDCCAVHCQVDDYLAYCH